MNWIKKLFASPYIKSFLPSNGWALAGFLIAVLLVALLIFIIIKRRKKATPPVPEAKEVKEDFLAPKSLVKVWKLFLKNIPAQFRRSIMMYQPYIVMGEAGTGKTSLIDTYSDWKNQANQFYPSYNQDSLLQIFLGSRIIVQEIPAALLHDTSTPTRKALVNLWKCFKQKKELGVVVTIKGNALFNGDPDSLKEQAQMLRGKINILSQILKRPVNLKVALTFMNHVAGFPEFSLFLRNNNMPFELEIDSQNQLHDLENFIKPYEEFFSNALLSEGSKDYLKIVAFCQNAPVMLSGLSRFLRILTDPDSLSASPVVNSIFFTSDSLNEDKPLSNPFKSHVSIKKVRSYHPLKKHKITAAALIIAGLSYLLFSYQYKLTHFQQIRVNLEAINNTMIKTDQTDKKIHDQVSQLLNNLKGESEKVLDERFLIDFFPGAQREIDALVIKTKKDVKEKIIHTVLGPELLQLKVQNDADKKNLLILGLIYASNSNALGALIRGNMDFWVTNCNIPRSLITSYLLLSDTSWDKAIPLKGLVDKGVLDTSRRDRSWLLFLKNVEKSQKKSVSPQALSRLQKEAVKLIDELDDSLQTDWFDTLRKFLATETVLGDYIMPGQQGKSSDRNEYKAFKKFLDFFWQLKLDTPEVENITLEELFENLRIMMEFENKKSQKFHFEINNKRFYFNSNELNELITKSSMVMVLKNYAAYYSRYPGLSFFHPASEYEDLVVGISSDDNFYFSQKAALDGRYTKNTYEKDVMPVLKELPGLLEKLPISKAEKTQFSNFMFREVEAYIRKYRVTYETYYKGFKIDADSVGELRYILTQMTLPMGQFQDFLMLLNENLALEHGGNPYFDLIRSKLRPLGFIPLLMQVEKNQFPELIKYKAILRQILDDLLASEPIAAKADDDGLAVLKGMLPPEARIGLDIFLDGPDSYLKMIQKWGGGAGIPEQMLYPFTAPVLQAYLLGQQKIENLIIREWKKMENTYIGPVMDKFPFNPNAQAPVTPEDLKKLAYPTGEFWKKFSTVIGPLCKQDPDGIWQERKFTKASLKYPPHMFREVNYISSLSRIFFNKKGEPQPLVFEVQPHPLPLAEKNLIFVVLSYIRSGKNTVFGFNQQPSWHRFSLEWWKPESASVGVEFMETKEKAGKIFANIAVPNSHWSFYRLLGKADRPEPLTWMWDIESPGEIQWKRAISFSIRKDPWIIFQETPFKEKNLTRENDNDS